MAYPWTPGPFASDVGRGEVDAARTPEVVRAVAAEPPDRWAFAMPVDRSEHENVKVRDLAERSADDILATGG